MESGGLFPGKVIYICFSHVSLSVSIESIGDGIWLGSIRARRPATVAEHRRVDKVSRLASVWLPSAVWRLWYVLKWHADKNSAGVVAKDVQSRRFSFVADVTVCRISEAIVAKSRRAFSAAQT